MHVACSWLPLRLGRVGQMPAVAATLAKGTRSRSTAVRRRSVHKLAKGVNACAQAQVEGRDDAGEWPGLPAAFCSTRSRRATAGVRRGLHSPLQESVSHWREVEVCGSCRPVPRDAGILPKSTRSAWRRSVTPPPLPEGIPLYCRAARWTELRQGGFHNSAQRSEVERINVSRSISEEGED